MHLKYNLKTMPKITNPVDTLIVIHRRKASKGMGVEYYLSLNIGPVDEQNELFENDDLHRSWSTIQDMYKDIRSLVDFHKLPMVMMESKNNQNKRLVSPEAAEQWWNAELLQYFQFDDVAFQKNKYKKFQMKHPESLEVDRSARILV
jgi:hypothetical protein